MAQRPRVLILAFALLGFGFASYSSYVHYRLITDPTYISPCDINATFNCSQVYLSRFGSVAGVPVALFGVVWFTLVALIAGFSRTEEKTTSPAASYVFALGTVGLAVIIYLAWASFVVLKTGCVLCIGTYVSVIAIFIISGLAASVPMLRLPRRVVSDVRAALASPGAFFGAVLWVVGAASVVAFFPREGTPVAAASSSGGQGAGAQASGATDPQQKANDDAFAAAWAQQPRTDMGIPAGSAKVLIVKFLDWQCPSCKAAHMTYKPVLDKFEKELPGMVTQIIKDFPLSPKCNFNVTREVHQAACEMSAGVRMARDRGKGDELIDWIFAQPDQQAITAAQFKAQATKMLGLADFDKEYAAKLPDIQRDAADGGAVKVGSTPTYFVNGIRAESERGWLPAYYFELGIKLELQKAGVTVK